MKAAKHSFVGARLTQGRKARTLNAVSLAELIGVTSAAISQYEHNKQTPRHETLCSISGALNLPQQFFLRPLPPEPGERRTKWRSNASATKFARERAESRYEWLRECTDYFLQFLDFLPVNFPKVDVPDNFRELTHEIIDAAADQCREFWRLGNEPIQDVVLLLESNGVIVSRGRLIADDLNAFSEWLDDDYPYVFLGSDKGIAVRSRFDAAHELGHLILHKGVPKRQYGTPADFQLLEKQAHRFAAAFLLPKEAFFKELWAPTLDAFASLKARWKVSIKGMIVHSHRHGLLSDTQYQRTLINYNRRWKGAEPLDGITPMESPRFLPRCVEMLVAEGVKSKEQIANDLPFAHSDIEELLGLPSGYFRHKQAQLVELPTPTVRRAPEPIQGSSSAQVIPIRPHTKTIG